MKFDKFISSFVKGNRQICTNINGMSFYAYRELANLTSLIDYACDFDEKGICKRNRRSAGLTPPEENEMCCCRLCALRIGYLDVLPNNVSYLFRYAKNFDEKTGYWRKGKGCVLVRSMRSPTCLAHECNPNRYKNSAARKLFHLLKDRNSFMPDEPFYKVRNYLEKALRKERM